MTMLTTTFNVGMMKYDRLIDSLVNSSNFVG
jgi:hypothetical protein